jgi:hypothetical protein
MNIRFGWLPDEPGTGWPGGQRREELLMTARSRRRPVGELRLVLAANLAVGPGVWCRLLGLL